MKVRSSILTLVAAGCLVGAATWSVAENAPAAREQLASLPAQAPDTSPQSKEINPRLLRRFAPIAVKPDLSNPLTPEKVELGRMLFFETRLSKSQTISCNSCHRLDRYGVDNRPTSPGHKGQLGGRNSPTVFNASNHFLQFWDGRAPTVEEQAKGPILNPVEMANSEERVVATLKSIPQYVDAFRKAFPGEPDPVTYDNVGRAIGAFERQLVTQSRWDKYIAGDTTALTDAEKQGLKTFLNSGCMVCHTGPQVGAAMFQRVGVIEPWPNQKDQGRYEVTKQEGDRMMFKVPSLRNIEKTGPYFHDGSAATLEQAIHMMGKHQLGLDLSDEEVASIKVWMGSLTGELPGELIAKPELPPSTPDTPKPVLD
jgi:cytochrome c peroxidase